MEYDGKHAARIIHIGSQRVKADEEGLNLLTSKETMVAGFKLAVNPAVRYVL